MKKVFLIIICTLALTASCSPDDEDPQRDIHIEEPDTSWTEVDFRY